MGIESIILEPCDSSSDGHLNRKGTNSVNELTKSLIDDFYPQPVKQKIIVLMTKSIVSQDGGVIVACNLVGSGFNVYEDTLPKYEDISELSSMLDKYESQADIVIIVTDDPLFNKYIESRLLDSPHANSSNREHNPHKRKNSRLIPSYVFSGR